MERNADWMLWVREEDYQQNVRTELWNTRVRERMESYGEWMLCV